MVRDRSRVFDEGCSLDQMRVIIYPRGEQINPDTLHSSLTWLIGQNYLLVPSTPRVIVRSIT